MIQANIDLDLVFNVTKLDIEKCGDNFNYTKKYQQQFKDLSAFYCIKDKSYLKLGGSFTTNYMH